MKKKSRKTKRDVASPFRNKLWDLFRELASEEALAIVDTGGVDAVRKWLSAKGLQL